MPDVTGVLTRTVDHALVDLAVSGLSRPQKTLPAKLFYDEEGCRLFYRITELPEYYLTRTELSLLPEIAPLVVAALPIGAVLVEYGASDDTKAQYLLRQRNDGQRALRAYVPIDVALPSLERMRERLNAAQPDLAVYPLAADFMDPVLLPLQVARTKRLGFFPGSTIGNLDSQDAVRFLSLARVTLGADSLFLVGADLRKDPSVLLPAYDDPAGVTAAFNRNMLVRLNREAGADFDVTAFDHRALWNDAESRIEMHLVSYRAQTVRIAGHRLDFAAGETIHTENSYKHTAERFSELAARAGWQTRNTWTDPQGLFALYLLEQRNGH